MLTPACIDSALLRVGVCPQDLVMIHADAGPAAQMTGIPFSNRLKVFIETLLGFFDQGNVIVPTFSYSFTQEAVFDPMSTPSQVGLFSEAFRRLDTVKRSCHPLFSVAAHGSSCDALTKTSLFDCFGPGTLFEALYQDNAKILCIGCPFDRVTFVHFVEQSLRVSYRYFKTFKGFIECSGQKQEIETRYFVRDLTMATECDLTWLKEKTLENGCLKMSHLGRFSLLSISARDFFDTARLLIENNPFALIKHRYLNA